MGNGAAIFDLDRTVLRASSAPVVQRHMVEAGLSSVGFPAERWFQAGFELLGESSLLHLARRQSGAQPGWHVDDIRQIAERIADEMMDMVHPFVPPLLAAHRAEGRTLVLATASNTAQIGPLAERLGFDVVIGSEWEVDGDRYTGRLVGGRRLIGGEKRRRVLAWARRARVDLEASWFYTDSRSDIGLLVRVGHPVAVNPDPQLAARALVERWPIRYLDKPDGVVKIVGRELQDWLRPFSRPGFDLLADVRIDGLDRIPAEGGAVIVFNHRSYYDPTVMGYVIARSGRSARFLGKKEVFDVPLVGQLGRALGGTRVDRGTGSDEPLDHAVEALVGGDVVALAPQGTIPRGPAFFDPELKGRWGAARLAIRTGVPVVPVGLWGTEHVWPRSQRLPSVPVPGTTRPVVTANVGRPFRVGSDDPDAATAQIMERIVDQLPPEARVRHTPTDEELARTYPPGYRGDPGAESDRRPGTDT